MDRYFERFLISRHYIEFRLLRKNAIRRHWVRPAEVTDLLLMQLALMNTYGWDIYTGVNPRAHSCSDAAEVVALHADVDGLPKKSDLPAPSLVVNSGHGYHLYWELQSPVPASPTITAINRGIALIVGADPHCCDTTRILRVPGMTNLKEPRRSVVIESETSERYRPEDFANIAKEAEHCEHRGAPPQPLTIPSDVCAARSLPSLENVLREDAYLRRAWRGDLGDGASDSRYAAILRLNAHGFSLDEIESFVGERRWFNTRSKRVTPRAQAVADVRRVLAKA